MFMCLFAFVLRLYRVRVLDHVRVLYLDFHHVDVVRVSMAMPLEQYGLQDETAIGGLKKYFTRGVPNI